MNVVIREMGNIILGQKIKKMKISYKTRVQNKLVN